MHLNETAPVSDLKNFSCRDALHFYKKYIVNQQSIVQSNLLDIIFENRNEDYGAYKLRKSYQAV